MNTINENRRSCDWSDKRLLTGTLLLTGGLLLLANYFGYLPDEWRRVIVSWEMLLVVIGLYNLLSRQGVVSGIVLLVVGGYFLLTNKFDFDYNLRQLIFPTILIVLGLYFILRRGSSPRLEESSITPENMIDDLVIFGGSDKKITSAQFRGGKVTEIFGGSNYDMLEAQLGEGTNVLEFFTVFGGSKLLIPSDWVVNLDVVAIFGGFSDKRFDAPRTGINPEQKTLHIRGLVIFGGGEIKSI